MQEREAFYFRMLLSKYLVILWNSTLRKTANNKGESEKCYLPACDSQVCGLFSVLVSCKSLSVFYYALILSAASQLSAHTDTIICHMAVCLQTCWYTSLLFLLLVRVI